MSVFKRVESGMNTADELDDLIRSTLGESLHSCQPSPAAWARIVDQIKREEDAWLAAEWGARNRREPNADAYQMDVWWVDLLGI